MSLRKNITSQLRALLAIILFTSVMVENASAQILAYGAETIVNTTTAGNQSDPAIAMDASGNYVVVWASEDQDGEDFGIYFQRYDNTGTAVGVETQANVTTAFGQRNPDVAMSATGEFAICWQSNFEDTDGLGVWYAVYDNSGTLVQRQRVNDSAADEQMNPKVAMRHDGYFIVGYADDGQDGNGVGISYQPFSVTGVAQIGESVANPTTTGYQALPDIAMDSAGNYTWVWQTDGQDGDRAGIFGQRYDQSYSTVGSEFQVNTTTAGNQQEVAIAKNYNGDVTK